MILPIAAIGVGIAAAAPGDPVEPDATASALVGQVSLPGQPPASSGLVAAPPTGTGGGPFSYPEDGSVLRVGSSTASVTAQPGLSSSAQSVVDAFAVSLFGGEITADAVEVGAGVAAGPSSATADVGTSSITALSVLGQPVTASQNVRIALADWGTLDVLSSDSSTRDRPRAAESSVTGLRVRLLAEHAGLPAGTEIVVGVVEARAEAAEPAVAPAPTPRPKPSVVPPTPPPRPAPNAPREPGRSRPGGAPPELVRPAPEVTATLTRSGYVFPVFGPASFGDSFGVSRPNVAGGWHHGEDIVAPMGSPLLAVADGVLFSVGWNDIGGWRLWLRDDAGNEFYYAHLSAYAPVAAEGARVEAGTVIGFLGRTGDAEGSVPHLHFEIHPAPLRARGYDGVVAPYPFLVAWRRAEDASFDAGRQYLPGAGGGGPVAAARAGAILLEASDISTASGLVPGALERALVAGARSSPTP